MLAQWPKLNDGNGHVDAVAHGRALEVLVDGRQSPVDLRMVLLLLRGLVGSAVLARQPNINATSMPH